MWGWDTSADVRAINESERSITLTLKAPSGMKHVISKDAKEADHVPFKLFKYFKAPPTADNRL